MVNFTSLLGGDQAAYPAPRCRLKVNGEDITAMIEPRLIGLELTDNRGLEADQLDIRLSDHDGQLAIPPRGARLQLWLGWSDSGLIDKGSFVVDEVEHSGAPDTLSIRGRGADLRAGLKVKRDRSWQSQTVGSILTTVATTHGLCAVVSPALAEQHIEQLDQANESDANLLSRLGLDYDAVATVKAGHLLFMPTGGSTSANGVALPHIELTRADGDQHRFLQADRNSYSGARAHYYEANRAEKKSAIAGAEGNLKTLRHLYTDARSALAAARAEWNRLLRGSATLSYTLAKGRPDLIPELTYSLHGVKEDIDAIVWLGANVRHSFTPEAFTTALELDAKLPDIEDLSGLVESGPQNYTGVVAWYRSKPSGKQRAYTAGDATRPRPLAHLYASEGNAKRAAERALKRMREAPGVGS
ncbi:phage late control D family protein [Pseudomonas japonica]|uniref:phage late control D family protein n=1 Tax=Pseudomonas japonica TaxID=256466 RepID=UPI0015E47FBB|nr:phage late control D family protein [Pseudomonas japonica]MBA1289164.1 phage late control D family protein [Pseudomonas japonica]